MTDLLDDVADDALPVDGEPATICQRVLEDGLCGVPLPLRGEPRFRADRKYCEDHKARQAPPKKKKERAPRSVQPKITVQVGNTARAQGQY